MFKEFSIIFIHIKEKLRKTANLVILSCSLTTGLVFRKVVAVIAVRKCELYHFAL